MAGPTIHRIKISRFRGIAELEWLPGACTNIILGGGDVGKTTLLDAIGLLLNPTNSATLSDVDYYQRDLSGFVIETVMTLPPETLINQQTKPAWPWEWNGTLPVVPSIHEGHQASEPVYVLRVSGTPELELIYEIVQPNGDTDHLPAGLRRAIGVIRLSGDDRNDRDLRLVHGSALERLLSDKALRSRLANKLAKSDVASELAEQAKTALASLDDAFKRQSLPHALDLALTGAQGVTIAALIGLTADHSGTQLPLASWGAGTRRLAALAIAEQNQQATPIILIDEIERGLEPYRQRLLIQRIQGGNSQAFVTTHSAPAIAAATEARIWYVDSASRIGPLDGKKIAAHQRHEPETFLARLAIIGEGLTEVGFASALLEKALGSSLDQYGVRVSDGGGHEATLDLLEALADGGLIFGGFVDEEGKHPERWKRLHQKLGTLLFRWKAGCVEENVINAVPLNNLFRLIEDPQDELTGMRLRTLALRLGIPEKDYETITMQAGENLKSLIIGAALGSVPTGREADQKELRAHARLWFKTQAGGRELAGKILPLGAWKELRDQLLPLLNAVRKTMGLSELTDLN